MSEAAASRNQTIREHLEAIRDWAATGYQSTHIQEHAVAALDQLDSARILVSHNDDWELLDDAEFVPGRMTFYGLVIDDPDPGVGAEHAPKEHP